MKRVGAWVVAGFISLLGAKCAFATLTGPWLRYDCPDLGFQIPVTYGWRVTSVPNGVVIAMQYAPNPYVRVAVGRITAKDSDVRTLIDSHIREKQKLSFFQRKESQIDGHLAVQIEGRDADGAFRDVFVVKGKFLYWIGFVAEQNEMVPSYSQTFDIVTEGFRFSGEEVPRNPQVMGP